MKFCKDCGKEKSRKGIHCKKCGYLHRKRPKGLKYNIVCYNSGWFKKGERPQQAFTIGHIPWNKGLHGIHLSPHTEFTPGSNRGENNCNWKGVSVGYFGLHFRIYKLFGKATKCSKCGSIKNVHWSNISGTYLEDSKDWIQLCPRCHFSKDRYELKIGTRKKASEVFANCGRSCYI